MVVNIKSNDGGTIQSYPILRRDPGDGQIIMFIKENEGVCLVRGSSIHDVGEGGWNECDFPEVFDGVLEISNGGS